MNDTKSPVSGGLDIPGTSGAPDSAKPSAAAKKKLRAAAISYDSDADIAPKVRASGQGAIAEKIVQIAREAGIPIQEDPALAEILSRIDPGEDVPPDTYLAIAEILVFIYKLDQSR
jgi:flagellar biosynthesis protein